MDNQHDCQTSDLEARSMKLWSIQPTTGFTDARSEPIDTPQNGYRYAQNFGVVQQNRLCRSPGWQRLLDRTLYNNADLHDALLSITTGPARKAINFLFEAESLQGQTTILAGTDDALYAFNPATANWRVINNVDPGPWKSAGQVGNSVVIANATNAVVSHSLGQPVIGGQATSSIPHLIAAGVTAVNVVMAWRNVMFYMGVVQDGQSYPNRILWSDMNGPLSILPATADSPSIAGDHDLDSNESILTAEPMANTLLIYTNRSIWEMGFSGGAEVFSFGKRYAPNKTGDGCLAYPRTLVNDGQDHIFMARDGIYIYNLFLAKPKRVDWIHRGSSLIFNDINSDACGVHCAEYFPDRKEVWFSWAQAGQALPSRTFVINVEFPFSAIVDHGFSAFVGWTPRPVAGVRDLFLGGCICTPEEFDTNTGGFDMEGGFCYTEASIACDNPPDSIYSTATLALEDGIVMEDFTGDPTSNSICSQLAGQTVADFCAADANAAGCNTHRLFVGASSTDFCLKQMSDEYYRERCTIFTGCGTYVRDGYHSVLRSGPLDLGDKLNEKEVLRFFAEISAALASHPAQVVLRIGGSANAVDPNDANCAIMWFAEDPKFLECLADGSEDQYLAAGTRPNSQYEWPTYNIGRYIYFELTVVNASVNPVDTGGSACFSRYELGFKPAMRRM